jgi:GNAT superfamily N-acetyltransferase
VVSIVPVSGLDPDREALFAGWAAVFEASARAALGDAHDAWGLDELRELERSTTRARVGAAALDGERVVGGVVVITPTRDNLDTATVVVAVRPESRRRGTGSMLLAWAEATAASLGRSVLHSETAWREGADPYAAWAAARGYLPALTALRSDLDLHQDLRLDRLAALAATTADGYVLESAVDGIPESWWADRAVLQRRMSTDAPTGDLVLEEEEWDGERVGEEIARTAAMGRRSVETVARHLPTGRLVGFTHVQVTADRPQVAYQHDTLVLREHRGHRLGIRLKAANARALCKAAPGVRTVRTWNALDNAPMLAVNRELGYRPSGLETEWQKVLGEATGRG